MKISTAIIAAVISAPATEAFSPVQSNSRCASSRLHYIDPRESDGGLWTPTQKTVDGKEEAIADAATSKEVENIMKSVDEAISMMNSVTVQSALSVPETKQASETEIDTVVLEELARKLSIEIDPAELENIFLSAGENPTKASSIEKKVTLEEKVRLWNETYHQFSDSIQNKEDLIRVAHEITSYTSHKISNPDEDAIDEFFSAWKKFSSGAIDFTVDSMEIAVETVKSPEFQQKTAEVASNFVSFLGKQKIEIPLLKAAAKDVTTSTSMEQTEEDQEKQRLAYFESVSKNVSPTPSIVVEETTDEDEKIKQRLAYFESVRARVAEEEKEASVDFIQEPKPIFSNNYLDGLK
ncbi:predicted protein [Chaetoceros tenuissimus]|uniref:Plastid lipid-associated protein/fibrillin conserved domain-containing protein n=1 Tax=Chaetoceros tenuissimus TaxID=426638 RepID=A0AAD3HF43_9STRA|nr:predicted protein [Chaetoceros tenuissimus]